MLSVSCSSFWVIVVIQRAQNKWFDEPQNTRESKANVVSSFSCKHELLKFDPVSWSQCLLALTERCHSLIALTQAHFHLCFHFHEHAWPATAVEHGIWATEQQIHGQTHSWGSIAVCPGYSTCYGGSRLGQGDDDWNCQNHITTLKNVSNLKNLQIRLDVHTDCELHLIVHLQPPQQADQYFDPDRIFLKTDDPCTSVLVW